MKKTLLITLLSAVLASPLSVFAEELHNHDMNKEFDVAASVEYSVQNYQKKVIFSTNDYEIVLFSFTKEQGLKEHTVPFSAFLQIIEGEALLIMDGKDYHLKTGEGIKLNMNKSHTLKAKTEFKMLLTKQKGKILQ